MLPTTGFDDGLLCAGTEVFKRRLEERCTFEGFLMNVAQPRRAVEAQSSYTQMHQVLSLVLLVRLK